MEAVIFIGIQATGKSTFYLQNFFRTHVRINLDMLRTRRRERILVRASLEAQQSFVVDNTNPTVVDRSRYILPARKSNFRVVGYYFQSVLKEAIRRNERRPEEQRIPIPGIGDAAARLELPSPAEGFDDLHYVRIGEDGAFIVEAWQDSL